jgi:tetratricopeptide (TPR) repeat protein
MGLFGPSYHSLCEKGIKAFHADDLEGASGLFLSAIKIDSTKPRAFGWLGMVYARASNDLVFGGDNAKQREYGELALKAFNEAIQRENDSEMKAEYLWQKGVVLGGLNRLPERDTALREADKASPGFTARRQQSILGAFNKI